MSETMDRPKTDIANNPTAGFSRFLDTFKPQLKLALPAHLNADRMCRLALTAFSKNALLQQADPKSLAGAILTASQLGLEIEVNGQAYLVPYKSKGKVYAQLVPGWKGLVDLVARSGRGTVYTGVIYKDQNYTYKDGSSRDLTIHNETDLDRAEDITHAYAIGWVVGAAMPIIELWRMSKIIKHRDAFNKVGSSHYSYDNMEMYARKVPLLQVLKYMPASVELNNAIAVANATETGARATIEQDGSGAAYVTLLDEEDGDQGGQQGNPPPPPTPMPTRKSDKPSGDQPATTPARAPPPPAQDQQQQRYEEPTGEAASPALVSYLTAKVASLGWTEPELAQTLRRFNATSIATLTPSMAMSLKAELAQVPV